MAKLKHWCGVWSKNGLEGALVLGFGDCVGDAPILGAVTAFDDLADVSVRMLFAAPHPPAL